MRIEIPREINSKLASRYQLIKAESLKSKEKNSLARAIRKHLLTQKQTNKNLRELTIFSVIADLIDQGWDIKVRDNVEEEDINERHEIHASPPQLKRKSESLNQAKGRIREGHLIGANKQFTKSSVRNFIQRMHTATKTQETIELLIDNPKTLIEDCLISFDENKDDCLKSVIDPYLQEARSDLKDQFTNIKLTEIWRYFRLTWSLEYKTNPGRSLPFLIRNKARPNHPIMGIAMMASPVIGLGPRDKRLRLTKESFLEFAHEESISLDQIIIWIDEDINKSLKALKTDDLPKINWRMPKETNILELFEESKEAKKQREILGSKFKNLNASLDTDTVKNKKFDSLKGEMDFLLFKAKRADKLSKLVKRKITLNELKKDKKKFDLKLEDVNKNSKFLDLLGGFITAKRTSVMDSDVMDLSVCGGIFPYNSLISGKLVALLMASNEARDIFHNRYKNSEREIARKMAGRHIRKSSTLRCLTTTSIYGVGSSQYNRLKINVLKGKKEQRINWENLGESMGYGTYHFSDDTQDYLDKYLNLTGKTTRINYEFGEGTSPRMRRLRESMSNLGFRSDGFFQHQNKRITYLCDLYESTPHEIYGLKSSKPRNISQNQISKAWRKRWLEKRIHREEIQKQMKTAQIKEQLLSHKIESIESE